MLLKYNRHLASHTECFSSFKVTKAAFFKIIMSLEHTLFLIPLIVWLMIYLEQDLSIITSKWDSYL